jgi:hypothetical protein
VKLLLVIDGVPVRPVQPGDELVRVYSRGPLRMGRFTPEEFASAEFQQAVVDAVYVGPARRVVSARAKRADRTSKRNLFMTIEWEARQQAGQRSVSKIVSKRWGVSRRYLDDDVRPEHTDAARAWLQQHPCDLAAVVDLCDQVCEAIPRQRAG